MKTAKAAAVSKNLARGSKPLSGAFARDDAILDMLDEPRHWPEGAGLYCTMNTGDLTENTPRFQFQPFTNERDDIEILGFNILGFRFVLLFEAPDSTKYGSASKLVQVYFGAHIARAHIAGMTKNFIPLSKDGLRICSTAWAQDHWLIDAETESEPACPSCQTVSTSRHSRYTRVLRDLPVQGIPVRVRVATSRWRCRNPQCERRIFTTRLQNVAIPHARWTSRLTEILRVFGHGTGGRPAERLLGRLGMAASDNTILRHLYASGLGRVAI